MKLVGDQLRFSATDLVGYLNCRHLSGLEHAAAKGEMAKPKYYDPLLEALWERGAKHEHDYVDHLASLGLQVVQIDGVEITDEAVAATIAAMKSGSDVIVQGPRPDHQPQLYRDEGCQRVQGQDHGAHPSRFPVW